MDVDSHAPLGLSVGPSAMPASDRPKSRLRARLADSLYLGNTVSASSLALVKRTEKKGGASKSISECQAPTGATVAQHPKPRPESVTQQPEPRCPA